MWNARFVLSSSARFSLLAGLLMGGVPLGLAQAKGVCSGTYSASIINPLPRGIVISLGSLSSSQTRLAKPFSAGMQDTGMRVDETGDVLMQAGFTFQPPARPDSTGQDAADFYRRFGWVESSWMDDNTARLPSPRGLRVGMAVVATNATLNQIAWIALINCTVTTDDPQSLMFKLGGLIGRSIGKAVQESPI
jgi:hypothetical protein